MTELCSICLAARATIDPPREIEALLRINLPWLEAHTACCASCARRFRRALTYFRAAGLTDGSSPPILPTGLRLGASARFRGRGVTIAFLDAGFYAHPDLITPVDRIREYVDVTRSHSRRADIDEPSDTGWHGMMTSVAACGNGALSQGLYRGIASEADVVLVQCGTAKRVFHNDIRRGFDWILRNRHKHDIRIINVSVGGDYEASYLDDPVCEGVEAATSAGILVCAAVGNAGYSPRHPVIPPASSPSALSVGGFNDRNRLSRFGVTPYQSSYGPTIDGLQKPELVAPSIWLAAPLLPGTETAQQAGLYSLLLQTGDSRLAEVLASHQGIDEALDNAIQLAPPLIRQLVSAKYHDQNVISESYKHVDGTSFSSPIVASIAAQMIEANPSLKPLEIKAILTRTARRVEELKPEQQGFGVVDPRAALFTVLVEARKERRIQRRGRRRSAAALQGS
ncbi:MAG: S8 family serine peptidase [Vicinamibacteria bacterium]|nr:S8 family serine peptidase [Vicinamibacteria bacterium]